MSRPAPGGGRPPGSQGDLFGEPAKPRREAPAEAKAAPPRPLAPAPAPQPPAPAPEPARRAYPWRSGEGAEGAPSRKVLSVGELTRQIKVSLERGFTRVCVRGEVSGFRGPNPRGHLYFSLKDADACIETKVWASLAQRLKFRLREGLEVIVEGSVDVYEPSGRYSLIAQKLEPAGEGALALAFQQLKERLAAEGLLGEKRLRPPRPLPFLPRRIGVVTSRSGAALQDFLRVLLQRNPKTRVLLADARVQGDGAAEEVVSAIGRLSRTDVDVIVVTRGGGSAEDLWTFNEETVARAIHACPVPVVSAIGHEVDFTIADFVADHRAPTPTAAAQLLSPVLEDLVLGLATSAGRLRKAAERSVLLERQRLHSLSARLSDPRRLLGQKQLHLSEVGERVLRALRSQVRAARERHRALDERLQRCRPEADLARKRQELGRLSARLRALAALRVREERARAARLERALGAASPAPKVHHQRSKLGALAARLEAAERALLARWRTGAERLGATLHAVSPLRVMARGYAVVLDARGHVVRGAGGVSEGDPLTIQLAAGKVERLADCDEVDVQVTSVKRPRP